MIRNNSVAAALAVLPGKDDSPRVIRQYTSIFLVSRAGELWRVYDTDAPNGIDREMPSPTSERARRAANYRSSDVHAARASHHSLRYAARRSPHALRHIATLRFYISLKE